MQRVLGFFASRYANALVNLTNVPSPFALFTRLACGGLAFRRGFESSAHELGAAIFLLSPTTDTASALTLITLVLGASTVLHLSIAPQSSGQQFTAQYLEAVLTIISFCALLQHSSRAAAAAKERDRKQPPNPTCLADFVPFCETNLQDPYPFYKALRDEAPVYQMPSGYYVVSRYRDVVRLAKDTKALSSNLVAILLEAGDGKQAMLNKPNLDVGPVDVLALADPPVHTKQRKIAMHGLSPRLFVGLEAGIRERCVELMSCVIPDMSSSHGCDWMERFAFRLPMMIALELVGFPVHDHGMVKAWADHGVALLSGVNSPGEFAEHTRQSLELLEYVRKHYNMLKDTHEDKVDDQSFTSHLIRATLDNEDVLSDEESVSIIFQILLAGNDSSASTIGSSVKLLCENPQLQQKLRDEPDRIADFVEETLRFESPFGGHFRKVSCPMGVNVDGTVIPDGARVMLLWGSANRDERHWEDPETISIDRQNRRAHVAFGFGIHACLGQKLARIEVKVVIEELLKATTSIERSWQECRYISSAFVRSPECLWIRGSALEEELERVANQ